MKLDLHHDGAVVTVGVIAERGTGAALVTLAVSHPESDARINWPPAVARSIARQLSAMADEADLLNTDTKAR